MPLPAIHEQRVLRFCYKFIKTIKALDADSELYSNPFLTAVKSQEIHIR